MLHLPDRETAQGQQHSDTCSPVSAGTANSTHTILSAAFIYEIKVRCPPACCRKAGLLAIWYQCSCSRAS